MTQLESRMSLERDFERLLRAHPEFMDALGDHREVHLGLQRQVRMLTDAEADTRELLNLANDQLREQEDEHRRTAALSKELTRNVRVLETVAPATSAFVQGTSEQLAVLVGAMAGIKAQLDEQMAGIQTKLNEHLEEVAEQNLHLLEEFDSMRTAQTPAPLPPRRDAEAQCDPAPLPCTEDSGTQCDPDMPTDCRVPELEAILDHMLGEFDRMEACLPHLAKPPTRDMEVQCTLGREQAKRRAKARAQADYDVLMQAAQAMAEYNDVIEAAQDQAERQMHDPASRLGALASKTDELCERIHHKLAEAEGGTPTPSADEASPRPSKWKVTLSVLAVVILLILMPSPPANASQSPSPANGTCYTPKVPECPAPVECAATNHTVPGANDKGTAFLVWRAATQLGKQTTELFPGVFHTAQQEEEIRRRRDREAAQDAARVKAAQDAARVKAAQDAARAKADQDAARAKADQEAVENDSAHVATYTDDKEATALLMGMAFTFIIGMHMIPPKRRQQKHK